LDLTVVNNLMKRTPNIIVFIPGLILLSFLFSACAGLPGLPAVEEEQAAVDFGPDLARRERQARTLGAIWKVMEQNYIYYESADVDWGALQERYDQRVQVELSVDEFGALIRELEAELPEGSLAWQSRAERIEADLTASSSFQGIGAIVAFKKERIPHVVLLSVIEGSPAEQAGLRAHDSILSIDGEPVRLEEGLSVVERIRGPAGTSVTLEVQTPGRAKRSVTVTRGQIEGGTALQATQVVTRGGRYGYLLFPPVTYEGLIEDVLESMRILTASGRLDGLILDLRVTRSSTGWPLEEMFIVFHDGTVGEFYTRTEDQAFDVRGQDIFGSQSVPLVLLVGPHTIGLAEILAASLQESERAILVGAPTTGSIESASPFYLPDGSLAFVQSASFRLPDGEEPGRNGISPDVRIDTDWDEVVPDDDPVLNAALKALEMEQ
jgi:carboxyl-terminal processing protease